MGIPRLIILIRHAQSEGNKNREIHQVIPDHRVKLTEDGWRQAEEAGRRLRELLRPDDTLQIYTSPYRRTRETTEGILKTLTLRNDPSDPTAAPSPFSRSKITVYEEPRLREQDFGNFQPCSAEMERMWRERADYGHFFYRIPNGESAADAYDRVSGFNESLWRQFGDDDFPSVCVLVTHGLMTRVFLMKWYHWSVEYFEDLRNINHCEFILMSRLPGSGKYNLESKLRTWSELRRLKAEEALNNPLRRNTLSSFLATPHKSPQMETKQWGGCADGCNHDHAKFPRRQQEPASSDLKLPPAAQDGEAESNETGDHVLASHEKDVSQVVWGLSEQGGTTVRTSNARLAPSPPRHHLPPTHVQGVDALRSTSGANTPHEMSEDEAEYFNARQPRSMARVVQKAPERKSTPEDIARWTNESGMGRGKQADALGDEPEPRESIDGEVKGEAGLQEALNEVAEEERHDRSLRNSVY